MALFGVSVVAPAAAQDIGVDATLIGTFTAIVYSVAMVAGLMTGVFADRFGAIRVSQLLMIFALLGVTVLALASPLAAIASAVLLGLCYGPVNPVSTHILARVTSEKSRPFFFSVKQTGMPAGAGLAGLLLPLVTAAIDWRAAIVTTGVVAALIALFIQPLRPRLDAMLETGRKVRLNDIATPLKLVLGEPRLRCLAIVTFAYSGAQVTMMTFYVVYLTSALDLTLTTAGVIFMTLQVGAILGRLLWGAIAERLYPASRILTLLGVATGIFAVAVSLFSTAWPLWAIGVTSFLLGMTCAGWNGLFFSELVKYAPADRTGEAASGMQFIIMLGVAAVPPVFGSAVVATGSYGGAFLAIAGGMVAAAIHHRVVFR